MTLHSVSLDLAGALAPPRSCPCCGADVAVRALDEGVHFDCQHCACSWTLELGRLLPVRRGEDPGNQRASRRENCLGSLPLQRVPS